MKQYVLRPTKQVISIKDIDTHYNPKNIIVAVGGSSLYILHYNGPGIYRWRRLETNGHFSNSFTTPEQAIKYILDNNYRVYQCQSKKELANLIIELKISS